MFVLSLGAQVRGARNDGRRWLRVRVSAALARGLCSAGLRRRERASLKRARSYYNILANTPVNTYTCRRIISILRLFSCLHIYCHSRRSSIIHFASSRSRSGRLGYTYQHHSVITTRNRPGIARGPFRCTALRRCYRYLNY